MIDHSLGFCIEAVPSSSLSGQAQVKNLEIMGPPQPKTVMAASAKQVLRRLDNVDDRLKVFFEPAAKLVMAQSDPEDALSRALAALSGLLEVPKPRR